MLKALRNALAAGLTLAAVAAPAAAEQRMVFCEEFTATWCVYCPPVGIALSNLHDQYPDRFTFIQTHASDIYATTWGNQRMTYYNITGFPTTVTDGTVVRIGQYPAQQYINDFNARAAISTDTTLSLSATHVSGQIYRVRADLGIEASGTGKTMKLHLLQVLDHFPTGTHYRNCFMQNAPVQTITLTPGQTTRYEYDFTMGAASWNPMTMRRNIRMIAFLQAPATVGPQPIYQSAILRWPFVAGDVDADGDVDLSDLSIMMAYFGTESGAEPTQGDCDADEDVDLQDLAVLLGNFGS